MSTPSIPSDPTGRRRFIRTAALGLAAAPVLAKAITAPPQSTTPKWIIPPLSEILGPSSYGAPLFGGAVFHQRSYDGIEHDYTGQQQFSPERGRGIITLLYWQEARLVGDLFAIYGGPQDSVYRCAYLCEDCGRFKGVNSGSYPVTPIANLHLDILGSGDCIGMMGILGQMAPFTPARWAKDGPIAIARWTELPPGTVHHP